MNIQESNTQEARPVNQGLCVLSYVTNGETVRVPADWAKFKDRESITKKIAWCIYNGVTVNIEPIITKY